MESKSREFIRQADTSDFIDRERPKVMEIFGQPEWFADGWKILDDGVKSTVSILFFVTREAEHREVARVHIPRSEYEYWRSVYRAHIIAEAKH